MQNTISVMNTLLWNGTHENLQYQITLYLYHLEGYVKVLWSLVITWKKCNFLWTKSHISSKSNGSVLSSILRLCKYALFHQKKLKLSNMCEEILFILFVWTKFHNSVTVKVKMKGSILSSILKLCKTTVEFNQSKHDLPSTDTITCPVIVGHIKMVLLSCQKMVSSIVSFYSTCNLEELV